MSGFIDRNEYFVTVLYLLYVIAESFLKTVIYFSEFDVFFISKRSYGCNCRTRENCSLQNHYPELNNRADVENNANKGTKIYFSLAETSSKVRFANHNKHFSHEQYKKSTELSKYIWLLKEDQITSRIRWSVVEKVYGRTKINFCQLCLAEKLHLNENRLLN